MVDEETGTWWQQVTGEAIFGQLKGRRLKWVYHDQISFEIWKREFPQGRVLRPDNEISKAGKYNSGDWETFLNDLPAPIFPGQNLGNRLEPRAVVYGISINGVSKAYPFSAIEEQNPILDYIGGISILIVLGDDKKSVRAFETSIDGQDLEFFLQVDAPQFKLIDKETGSEWDFGGKATNGSLQKSQLEKIYVLRDSW